MQDAPRVAASLMQMRERLAAELPRLQRRSARLCERWSWMLRNRRKSRRLWIAARDAIGDELSCVAAIKRLPAVADEIRRTGHATRANDPEEFRPLDERVAEEFERRTRDAAGPSGGGSY